MTVPLHVALVAIGSHGDVHPFVGMGVRLRSRGHACTVLTNAHFEPLVRQAGLDFRSLAAEEEYLKAIRNPDLWHPMKGFHAVAANILQLVRPTYDALAELRAEHGDRLVAVSSTLGFGARLAEEKLGLPHATAHLSPSVFQSVHETPRYAGFPVRRTSPRWWKSFAYLVLNRVIDGALAGPLNEVRRGLDLPPVRRHVFKHWMHAERLVLGMFPAWFAPPQPDWPRQTRAVGFPLYDERGHTPLPDELERFLSAGDRPVAFTPGSAMINGRAFFEASAEACRLAGRRGVLLTRHAEQVPPTLPPGVVHVAYAPFSELLPRCAAVATHGGIGSLSQALAAGCPQLIHPFAHDQYDNADRLERLGVGRSVVPKKYKPGHVAAVLRELVESPAVATACAAVAERMKGEDALGTACGLIEGLAAGVARPAARASA